MSENDSHSDSDVTPGEVAKARRPKKGELVARRIVRELSSNNISAGSVLDIETDLMKRLDVSRASLREGVRILELVGVVESRRGRTGGLVVQEPDEADFARMVTLFLEFAVCTYGQLIEVYGEILAMMARRAATNATEEEIDRLRKVLADYNDLTLAEQVRSTGVVNDSMIAAIDNPIWRMVAASVRLVIQQRLEFLLVPNHNWPAVVASVNRLGRAVIDRDADLAEQLVKKQIAAWFDIATREQPGLLDNRVTWDG